MMISGVLEERIGRLGGGVLFTTPGLDPGSSDARFLLKDWTLFGAALWSSAEAFSAARRIARPIDKEGA